MKKETHIAIFGSGNGTNAQRICEYFKENPSIKISAIITNKKDAYIVERAKKLGIPYCYFNRNQFYSGNDVLSYLKENKIDYIILAGFLWLVPQNLLEAYQQNNKYTSSTFAELRRQRHVRNVCTRSRNRKQRKRKWYNNTFCR